MNKINILDEVVANKIAAGEVVENPASVIKELVENSIDANASKIDITLQTGGLQLIRVSDNGDGMSPEDAELACKRYATSKIHSFEDLDSIQSFGFRGEALPSIASVSRFRLQTREKDTASGTEVLIHGGKTLSTKTVAMGKGTVIEIEDLFYNTPARRKFLKSDRYEKAVVADTLTAMALANPEVGFTLQDKNKTVFNYPKVSNWLERMEQVFAEEFKEMIPIDEKKGEFHIMGVISKPRLHAGNRSKQYFFVNHRHVRYPKLSYTLQEAYSGYLLHGRHPYAILFINVNPSKLDVNIHPQKLQVKIEGEKILQEMLYFLANSTLNDGKPQPFPLPADSFSGHSFLQTSSDNPSRETMSKQFAQDSILESSPVQTVSYEAASLDPIKELTELDNNPFDIQRILGQIQMTYIVCESKDGMILIDQHAAHERLVFEGLKNHFEGLQAAKQHLLFPVTLSLSHEENLVMESVISIFRKFGFDMESLGKNTYSVSSYPTLFEASHVKGMIESVLDQFKQESQKKAFQDETETIAALMACKAKSVKANQKISMQEILRLIRDLGKCENPHHCPHGRPTTILMKTYEIEKRFMRKL